MKRPHIASVALLHDARPGETTLLRYVSDEFPTFRSYIIPEVCQDNALERKPVRNSKDQERWYRPHSAASRVPRDSGHEINASCSEESAGSTCSRRSGGSVRRAPRAARACILSHGIAAYPRERRTILSCYLKQSGSSIAAHSKRQPTSDPLLTNDLSRPYARLFTHPVRRLAPMSGFLALGRKTGLTPPLSGDPDRRGPG